MNEEFVPQLGAWQMLQDAMPSNHERNVPGTTQNPNTEINLNPPAEKKEQRDPTRASKFESFYFNGDFAALPQWIINPALNLNGIQIENAEFVSYEGLLSRVNPYAPALFGSMIPVGDPVNLHNKMLNTDRIAVAVANANTDAARLPDDVVEFGYAFVAPFNVAALAANFSQVELFNPAVSTVNLEVDTVALAAAGILGVRATIAALATALPAGVNKKLGGGNAAQGLVYSGQNAALQGTALESINYTNGEIRFDEPYILTPGNGIAFDVGVVNTAITGALRWRELEKSTEVKNVWGKNNRTVFLPPGYGLCFAGNALASSVLIINVHYKILSGAQ